MSLQSLVQEHCLIYCKLASMAETILKKVEKFVDRSQPLVEDCCAQILYYSADGLVSAIAKIAEISSLIRLRLGVPTESRSDAV
ncbi:hypothetical protein C7B82_20630 [Stenomitos frigidus ULC18]|uniref:Uncharacterized protein n=1 Tax=Stenomitos frigidus ULC18 TaxID=2107698 RepID=A0A2T1E0F8_9CYAN|nr:hypothetical protein C7B82_20630 [Stenomitos frigidus ULC18]